MHYQLSTYSVIYLVAATIALIAALFVWRRRFSPAAVWLFLLLLAVAERALADALDVSAIGLATKVFWGKVSWIGSATIAVFLLICVLEYVHLGGWLTARRRVALFIVPVLEIVAAFTNDLHRLLWTGFTFAPGGANVVIYHHGPLFWVSMGYTYALLAVATVLLLRFTLGTRSASRFQSAAIMIAIAIPILGEIAYDLAPGLLRGLDVAAITLTATGGILIFSVLRLKFLDLVPVALETLMENMPDGLLVLDPQGRIVDANPAAGEMVGTEPRDWVGCTPREVLGAWPNVALNIENADEDDAGCTMDASDRCISVRVSPLRGREGERIGSLVTMSDVSVRVRTERALQDANRNLVVRLSDIEGLQKELKEQAFHDPATGLYNRRYLMQALEREILRARQDGYPLSVVMIDVDHFKETNDTYGHIAGDLVLRALADGLRRESRPGDVAARFGGDEFLLVMPHATLAEARRRAEQWRLALAETTVEWHGDLLTAAVSMGVASFPEQGASSDAVLAAADRAVYLAKAQGRNRVV